MQRGMGGSTEGTRCSAAPPGGSKRIWKSRSLSRERVGADVELDDYFKLDVFLQDRNTVSTGHTAACSGGGGGGGDCTDVNDEILTFKKKKKNQT